MSSQKLCVFVMPKGLIWYFMSAQLIPSGSMT